MAARDNGPKAVADVMVAKFILRPAVLSSRDVCIIYNH